LPLTNGPLRKVVKLPVPFGIAVLKSATLVRLNSAATADEGHTAHKHIAMNDDAVALCETFLHRDMHRLLLGRMKAGQCILNSCASS
jgi:non-ribosomal peptide synthetase component F